MEVEDGRGVMQVALQQDVTERRQPGTATDDALIRRAVRANVTASVSHLRHGSEILERLIQTDGLVIVGAEYCLETGVVEFFEGL